MDTSTFIDRIKIANQYSRTRAKSIAAASSNPATVVSFVERRTDISLVKVQSADGGVGFQQKIYNRKVEVGEVFPASVKVGSFGFADGKAVL